MVNSKLRGAHSWLLKRKFLPIVQTPGSPRVRARLRAKQPSRRTPSSMACRAGWMSSREKIRRSLTCIASRRSASWSRSGRWSRCWRKGSSVCLGGSSGSNTSRTRSFDALLADRSSPLAKLVQSLQPKGAGRAEDGSDGDGDLALGRVVIKDFSNSRVIDRLLMYERRIEHSLYRTMAELQRLRLLRELDRPAKEPVRSVPAWGERGFPNAKNRVWGPRPRSPEEVGRGRPTYEETPHGVTTNAPDAEKRVRPSLRADASCKTKPICSGPNDGQVPCGERVMKSLAENGHEETKPICPAGLVVCP